MVNFVSKESWGFSLKIYVGSGIYVTYVLAKLHISWHVSCSNLHFSNVYFLAS